MHEPESIQQALAARLAQHLPLQPAEVEGLIETPPSPDMGDLALPCFTLARSLRKSPAQIAQDLVRAVELPPGIREARAAGPYLNFLLDRPAGFERVLRAVHRLGPAYGRGTQGAGKTVVLEFSSPNIAKHLAIHHLPSAAIGMALYRLYGELGYRCVRINFLGDWGTGFGRLIAAAERYGVEEPAALTVTDLQDLYVRYSTEAEDNEELQQAARDAGRRLEEGDPHAVALWEAFKAVSLAEFERVYSVLGIEFDLYLPESSYRDKLAPVVERLRRDGIAVESQGALIVPLEEEGLPPCMVRRSDGASLYATRDIAAAEHRWEQYHFDRSIYVVGGEQTLYFQQLKAVLRRMGDDWADRMEHVSFGMIKFRDPETGELRLGSTRSGDVVLLEDVLAEALQRARAKVAENRDRFEEGADLEALAAQIGIGAVIFSDLSVRRTRDVVFDWDRMLDFEGDTGPYVQYAHARLCSILRKAGREVSEDADAARLALEEEWVLLRHLERFPRAVERATAENEPSVIAGYLLELCADFSSYYSAGMREPQLRVLCPDEATRAARLLLVDAARHVIRKGLALLGIAAPERM
jgi:arginyl-tRNA synthetase